MTAEQRELLEKTLAAKPRFALQNLVDHAAASLALADCMDKGLVAGPAPTEREIARAVVEYGAKVGITADVKHGCELMFITGDPT